MSLEMEGRDDMAVDILTVAQANGNSVEDHQVPGTPIEELERELPVVYDGQIPLGDLLSRVVQAIYAELTEMAETLPSMSDAVRKRTIADWVVKTKKQVVKLYAVVKWSRDADTIQKCMNITAFLLTQNHQFEEVTRALTAGRDNLDPARLRNHDLLTSLDVLTTGSYLRLPTCIKKRVIPEPPLTDEQVKTTLTDMENAIIYRLRMTEIIPIEMSKFIIDDGRVHFTVPKLFRASLCLQGPSPSSGWFFVHVEFLITVGSDLAGLQEFPRIPSGIIKRHITDEADFRLSYYLLQDIDPTRPKLPHGIVDTPLIRLYNFLQMMALSYQLEILYYQAVRLRTLGWAEFLAVEISPDRKVLKASYWVRPPQPQPPQQRSRSKTPPFGGTLTISIDNIDSHSSRTPKEHTLSRLQQQSKLGNQRPSDEVEKLKLHVTWEPSQGVLGVDVKPSEVQLPPFELEIDPNDLDFEALLTRVIEKHVAAILKALTQKLQNDRNGEFSAPGIVDSDNDTLHIRLCADEVVTINIDPRTGRLNLRDTNGLVVAGRAPRFFYVALQLNQAPEALIERLSVLRLKTILDLAEQKARYLGLQFYRTRNLQEQDLARFGNARGTLFIPLAKSLGRFLVLLVKTKGFSFALITTTMIPGNPLAPLILNDIAFLNFDRIHGERLASFENGATVSSPAAHTNLLGPNEWGANDSGASCGFDLTTQILKELYNYCCARVAYVNVESQLKLRAIPYAHVNPTLGMPLSPELLRMQSSLARSVPALCVQATDILSGAPAAEAAMPNIRVIPINWWSQESAQVVTCVKLKYVQQPLGKRAGSTQIIRPSKRIIYDTKEAVVSFLSENVDTCVDEFLEEWARVSKMVVIAREIAKMSEKKGWKEIQLLSFDLQTVEFAYAPGYSVSIACEDQLLTTGSKFDLRFSRYGEDNGDDTFNPHEDAEAYLCNILRQGHGRLAAALERLVTVLRDTLPIAVELEKIRTECGDNGYFVDTFAKASGWYRILYPDLKHALDFRLLTDHRVAILDASHSLFKPARVVSGQTSSDVQMNADQPNLPALSTPSSSSSNSLSTNVDSRLGFQPIPGFSQIVKKAIAHALLEQKGTKYLADISVGLVCEPTIIPILARTIHNKVVEKLKAL